MTLRQRAVGLIKPQIKKRNRLRDRGDYSGADAIRDHLIKAYDIELDDSETRWRFMWGALGVLEHREKMGHELGSEWND